MLLICYCCYDCVLLFVADKGKQKFDKDNTEAPSSGKDVTVPTAAQQPRVKVEPPLVEDILRYPIEVFVSSGEAFVHPESTRVVIVKVDVVTVTLYKTKPLSQNNIRPIALFVALLVQRKYFSEVSPV